MKKKIFTFVFITLTFGCVSQEICNNGIDDDADGLIDLNDVTECICSSNTSTVITSLISNPSFEINSNCPFTFSQINYASSWADATQGTADYLNTCGFTTMSAVTAGLLPFPDGNGCAGGYMYDNYKEYIKTCLATPLLAGNSYHINFNVATMPMDGSTGSLCNGGVIYYNTPINLTIYGSTTCSPALLATMNCPTSFTNSWIPLGSVSYIPVASTWSLVSITFTPTISVSSIMLGSPCTVPLNYTQMGQCSPYFLFDNLILNESIMFSQPHVSITSTGSTCTNNLSLTANITPSVSPSSVLQWYLNGIAIVGATNNTYNVPSGQSSFGNYQVGITLGSYCALSNTYQVNSSAVSISVNSSTICSGESTILNAAGATSYSWSSLANTSSISVSPNLTTSYTVVGYASGCSDTTIATVTVLQTPTLIVNQDTSILAGNSVTLSVVGNGSTFNWTPNYNLSCTNCTTTIVSPTISTQYCVTTTEGACSSSTCVYVQVESPCYSNTNYTTPTAFTPNGDGINDEFCLKGWDECTTNFYIAIYNRWGEKIYDSSDAGFCWDGTLLGKSLNSDVFVFYINAEIIKYGKISKKGNLTLIK